MRRGITTPEDREREIIRQSKILNHIVSKGRFTPLVELSYTWCDLFPTPKQTKRKTYDK